MVASLTKEQRLKLQRIREELTINPKNLSAFQRRGISAPDDRPSAKAVGSVLGIGVLVAVCLVIVVPDIHKLICVCKRGAKKRLKKQI